MSVGELGLAPARPGRGHRRQVPWALRVSGQILLYGAILGAGLLLMRASLHANHDRGFYDFRGGLYNAGWAILHGRSFYQPGFLAHQVAIMNAGGIARGELVTNPFSIPVYPAFANVAVVPLALAPFAVAAAIYTLLSIAAMIGGLWLLGVRDWRCLVVSLISWPFLFGAFLGAVGPFLLLGVAALWHWRDRVWPGAVALAAIVAAKIFPWPLGIWLLITRRYRAAAAAVVAGIVITFGAWALIGFQGMLQYPRMLSDMSLLQEGRAISVATVLVVAGVPGSIAGAVALLGALAILAYAWRIGRRPGGERQAFGLAIIAAFTGTPIVWEHYMVLLFVPVALASPRFSRLWLVPMVSPLAMVTSTALIPLGRDRAPASPDALRGALLWLGLQAIVAVALCTTSEQRAAFRARVGFARRRVAA